MSYSALQAITTTCNTPIDSSTSTSRMALIISLSLKVAKVERGMNRDDFIVLDHGASLSLPLRSQ